MACRANGWPLDHSTLYTTVTEYTDKDDIENSPDTVKSIQHPYKAYRTIEITMNIYFFYF